MLLLLTGVFESYPSSDQKSALERQLEEEQRHLHAEAVHQKLLQDEETRIRAAQTDAAQDPGDQTESETVKELTDLQNEAGAEDQDSGEAAAGEEQPSETLNTDQSQSQDTQKENDEADVPSEENEPGPEKTGEDSDERQTETEDKESDRPETEDASDAAERQQEEEDGA
ncbi:DPY30 domain containing 2 isoform X2 [Cyprinus carpio]|uniref:DPY30 domain containing 2 isoform X2 n=1 Tax=Cyprinus carpio TaxID=7962 RepID=A0A9Q9YPU2_CYPCA|nr:DPY30 domain containing 2 isoform X2 [Cyprinus carpio]